MSCLILRNKMLEHTLKNHMKLINFLCLFGFTWQLSGILGEWIKPSQQTTQITETNLDNIELPLIKLCLDPAFNATALQEEGYQDIPAYFHGKSRYNSSIYGWGGHTKTSYIRGAVDQIYQKVQNFPTANGLLKG